jgi:hypothetical protein
MNEDRYNKMHWRIHLEPCNSQLATRNSQLATRTSHLATRYLHVQQALHVAEQFQSLAPMQAVTPLASSGPGPVKQSWVVRELEPNVCLAQTVPGWTWWRAVVPDVRLRKREIYLRQSIKILDKDIYICDDMEHGGRELGEIDQMLRPGKYEYVDFTS